MADIGGLILGTKVGWRDCNVTLYPGVVIGRRMSGRTEGDVDPDGRSLGTGKEPDRVKIRIDALGIPPETIAVTGDPANFEVLL